MKFSKVPLCAERPRAGVETEPVVPGQS